MCVHGRGAHTRPRLKGSPGREGKGREGSIVWQYQRCGFDLKVLPATFHRTVSEAPLPARGVKNWLDDILWPSPTFPTHMTGLTVVLQCLMNAGLTVNFQ